MIVAHPASSLATSAAAPVKGTGEQWARLRAGVVFGCGLLLAGSGVAAESGAPPEDRGTNTQTFQVRGVVEELAVDKQMVVIAHEAVPNYMAAMTMPFKVKTPAELAGLREGDKIRFRLRVVDTKSWVEGISKIGTGHVAGPTPRLPDGAGGMPLAAGETPAALKRHPLLDFPFTNELGQPVRLRDFRGQALAITFFFTRCPIPDYCPRLSKNFEEASEKLSAKSGSPTNWHFLSVTFDPEFDTPSVLKAYGERYEYDPKRWNFLTGPRDKISELAEGSGVKLERTSGFISHNFRTLIVDAAGHVQMVFPMGGNLSDAIVGEILKAAAVPNQPRGSTGREAEPRMAALAR